MKPYNPNSKECAVRLIDETGKIVADSLKDAGREGIFRKEVPRGTQGSDQALLCIPTALLLTSRPP
ncbi:MAG: hypothetical protein ISS53_03435 [Dehalococcoidia bacterium]|nr:hypothetical protein [Dehalococcoidia bacterium]